MSVKRQGREGPPLHGAAKQENVMNARRQRISRAQIRRLEKRVIAQWMEKYMGKKRRGRKREQVTGNREEE